MQYPHSNFRTFFRFSSWVIFLVVLFLFAYSSPAMAVVGEPSNGPEFVSNELLIKINKKALPRVRENLGEVGGTVTSIGAVDELTRSGRVKSLVKLAKPGKNSRTDTDLFSWYKVTFSGEKKVIKGQLKSDGVLETEGSVASADLQDAINALLADPSVLAVEPNYVATIQAIPNDPYYSSTGSWGQTYPDMWGMQKVNLEPAWDIATSTTNIVVADIDTGFDRNHPDLEGVAWTNPGEVSGNGLDDDANGYIDDYYGWDWVNNDNDPMDDRGHGTHTIGTIAAVGNNSVGVVGVNWVGKVIGLKFLDSSGNGSLVNAALALQYAADMGARVSSNSWVCGCLSILIDDAVKYEHDRGMVVVAAAGNDNVDALLLLRANGPLR